MYDSFCSATFPVVPDSFFDDPEPSGSVLIKKKPIVRRPWFFIGTTRSNFRVYVEDIPKLIDALREVERQYRREVYE